MLKRRIPEQYEFNASSVVAAIQSVLGNVPITIRGRFIEIDANPTPAQVTALRDAVVATLSTAQDITV